jgi:hypothetical protein
MRWRTFPFFRFVQGTTIVLTRPVLSRQEMSMQQIRYRVAVFIATAAIAVMASSVAEAGSRGQNPPGGGQAGSNTTASKNQSKPKTTIKFSPEYTRMQNKSGSSQK